VTGRLDGVVAVVVGAGGTALAIEARFITGVALPVDGDQSARVG
jgi:hypothetical protein